MKTALMLMISCACVALAQNPQTDSKPVAVKRLASVTWDLDTHKLVWVVQKGAQVNGEFVASSADRYEVSPEEALMAMKNETRDLRAEDAASAVDLVNFLSLYCAQSTDWWERGSAAGETAAPHSGQSGAEPKTPAGKNDKPTRVGEPERKKAPAPRLPGTLVAAVSPAAGK
jgi:hypothetical protein